MITGIGLDGRLGLSVAELTEAGVFALDLGYASLWTPQAGLPEAIVLCGQWVSARQRLHQVAPRIGVGVVPASYSHPMSLASQAATLAAMSDGRFVTGIGTGPTSNLAKGGDRPVALMRVFLGAVRLLSSGQSAHYLGQDLPALAHSSSAGLSSTPLYLAALGPSMLRLAGELADGVLLNWMTPEQTSWSREHIREGAARVGRDPSQIVVSSYVRVSVSEDVPAARRRLGTQVLSYVLNPPGENPRFGYRAHFSRMGFEEVISELEQRRDRGADLGELVDAAPDEFLHSVGYYGNADGVKDRLSTLGAGLDEMIVRVLAPPGQYDDVQGAITSCVPAS